MPCWVRCCLPVGIAWRRPTPAPLVSAYALGLALAAAVGLLIGCTDRNRQAAAPPAVRQLSAVGRMQPQDRIRTVSVSSSLSGDRLERILVKENQWVQQGQPLAVLSSHGSLQASLREAEALVALQRQRLAQVKAGPSGELIRAQGYRLSSLERRLQGERLSQDQFVASQRSRMEEARQQAQRLEPLFRSGGISQQQRDRSRSRALSSQAELRLAIESRTATLRRLQAEIANARATLAQLRQVRPMDVFTAQSELRQAIAVRDRARRELDTATVRAPEQGRILKIVSRPGDPVGEGGLLQLADTRRLIVIADVDQSDRARLRPGLGATISVAGIPASLRASIYQMSPRVQGQSLLAGEPGQHQDQRRFAVKLRLQPKAGQSQQLASAMNRQVKVIFDAGAAGAKPPH